MYVFDLTSKRFFHQILNFQCFEVKFSHISTLRDYDFFFFCLITDLTLGVWAVKFFVFPALQLSHWSWASFLQGLTLLTDRFFHTNWQHRNTWFKNTTSETTSRRHVIQGNYHTKGKINIQCFVTPAHWFWACAVFVHYKIGKINVSFWEWPVLVTELKKMA